MAMLVDAVTVLSSLSLRLISYIFLRWIPGHQLPPIIFGLYVIYLECFRSSLRSTSSYEIVAEEVDIVRVGQNGSIKGEGSEVPLLPSNTERPKEFADGNNATSEDKESELDITRTTIVRKKPPQVLKTLLLGILSPTSTVWNWVTVAFNTILVLFMVDMVFRARLLHQNHDLSFVRVGFVSHESASLVLREPDTSKLPVYVSYKQVAASDDEAFVEPWKSAGKVYWLSSDTDFTYSFVIPLLRPSTRYQYAASNNHSGYFVTAPPIGQTHPKTDKFTFLTSSCIKPRFPYNPFAHPLSVPGFKHLATWVPSLHASFMLFLGDFIYIDVPHRFGVDEETYRREYRQVYASPDWPSVSDSLPWLHVIDDHEIANDWDKNTTAPYPAAIDPWDHYQGSINPPLSKDGTTYFEFTQGPTNFFMMDTRRHRTPEFAADPASPDKTMLGSQQLSSLLTFLSRRDPSGVKWKIVVSSIPFTRNWRFNNADTWAGYLHERQTILEAMWDVGTGSDGVGVIILSGDRHEFAATAFPPPRDGKWPLSATVHEFSTSPLSMFYLPVRTYWEVDAEDDVCIKYLPDGNSKFGAVEISNLAGGEQSFLKFRLFVDGEEVWDYVVTSPPAVTGRGRGKDAVWG